jgi:hypothetical protein
MPAPSRRWPRPRPPAPPPHTLAARKAAFLTLSTSASSFTPNRSAKPPLTSARLTPGAAAIFSAHSCASAPWCWSLGRWPSTRLPPAWGRGAMAWGRGRRGTRLDEGADAPRLQPGRPSTLPPPPPAANRPCTAPAVGGDMPPRPPSHPPTCSLAASSILSMLPPPSSPLAFSWITSAAPTSSCAAPFSGCSRLAAGRQGEGVGAGGSEPAPLLHALAAPRLQARRRRSATRPAPPAPQTPPPTLLLAGQHVDLLVREHQHRVCGGRAVGRGGRGRGGGRHGGRARRGGETPPAAAPRR